MKLLKTLALSAILLTSCANANNQDIIEVVNTFKDMVGFEKSKDLVKSLEVATISKTMLIKDTDDMRKLYNISDSDQAITLYTLLMAFVDSHNRLVLKPNSNLSKIVKKANGERLEEIREILKGVK